MYTTEDHKLITRLRRYGINTSKTRIIVLRMLLEHKGALSVANINKYFSGSLDRVSIYRAFKVFLQKGLILKVPNFAGEVKYIFNTNARPVQKKQQKPVAFFVCTDCGSMSLLSKSPIRTFRLPDYLKVRHCHIILEGVCNECNNLLTDE